LRAQISLEFLLLLLAFLACFALLLPFYSSAYNAGIFALDSMNAKRFADSVKNSVEQLRFLGNGSSIEKTANPSLQWKIFSEKNTLFVSVKSASLGKEKIFSVIFPNEISFRETEFDSEKSFLVKKSSGLVSFENTD